MFTFKRTAKMQAKPLTETKPDHLNDNRTMKAQMATTKHVQTMLRFYQRR